MLSTLFPLLYDVLLCCFLSSHFTLRFSPRHLISCLPPRPAVPGPLTPIDPKSRPRNPSAAAVLSLSLSTHFKLRVYRGDIPFQHSGDSSTWLPYLAPLTCHKSSCPSLLLPDLHCMSSRHRRECGVVDKRLVWDQGC